MVKGAVKVIPWFVQFTGSPLPLQGKPLEPLAVLAIPDAILVATADGHITAYSLSDKTIKHCFRVASTASRPVLSVKYSSRHDAILAIEEAGGKNIVQVYTQWRGGAAEPLQAADMVTASVSELPGNCRCIAACPATGNLVAASNRRIGVFALAPTPTALSLTELVRIAPRCPVVGVSLCNEFLAYSSPHEVYCLRLSLEQADALSAVAPPGGALSGPVRDPDAVVLDFSQASGDDGAATVPSLLLHLPSISTELEEFDCTDIVRVENQNVAGGTGWTGAPWKCEQCLYRKFRSVEQVHTLRLIRSFQLEDRAAPGPAGAAPATTVSASASPLGHAEAGVCCFLSHTRHGYMYSIAAENSLLLSEYTYKSEGCNGAALNDYLLYVTTPGSAGSVDTYTIRNVLPGRVTEQIQRLPAVSLVGTMGGIISPHSIDVCDRTVVITTKHFGDTLAGAQSDGVDLQELECAYNVYALEVVGIMDLYAQLQKEAQVYIRERPFYLQLLLEGHFLLRANLAVLLAQKAQGPPTAEQAQALEEEMTTVLSLLESSCSSLAKYYHGKLSEEKTPDWELVASYCIASSLTLGEVLRLMALDTATVRGMGPLQSQAVRRCISVLLTRALSDGGSDKLVLSAKVAGRVIKIYSILAPHELPGLIVSRALPEFNLATTLATLQTIRDSDAARTSPDLRHRIVFCMGLIHLQQGKGPEARAVLYEEMEFVRQCCIDVPQHLFEKQVSDPWLPDQAAPKGRVASPLALFLLEQSPRSLKDILLEIPEASLSVATGVHILSAGDLPDPELVAMYLEALLSRADDGADTPLSAASYQTTAMQLAALYWARLQQGTPMARMLGGRSLRPSWLDVVLPPSSVPGSRVVPIHHLQALLSRRLGHGQAAAVAEYVYGLVTSDAGAAVVGAESLRLLCLPRLGLLAQAQAHLLEHDPQTVVPFTAAYVDTDDQAWASLLGEILGRRRLPDTPPAAVAGLDAALRATLQKLADTLPPAEFLTHLPADGNMLFFLPYIEACCRHASRCALLKDIEAEAAHIDS